MLCLDVHFSTILSLKTYVLGHKVNYFVLKTF